MGRFRGNLDFKKSMERDKKSRKFTLLIIILIFIGVVAAFTVVGMQLHHVSMVNRGRSAIAQLDIQSTYREPEFQDEDDWDGDGIDNISEKRAETDLQYEDTDGDGMMDGDELELGTDPGNEDSDGDGMLDGFEIMAGTNPKLSKTDAKTPDNALNLTIEKQYGDCTVTLNGNPNIAGATVEKLDIFGISSNPSVVSDAYDFYSDYKFDSADITINIDEKRLKRAGATYDDIAVLKFDVNTLEYTPLNSTSDSKAHTVTASITGSGTYLVGAQKTVNEPSITRVAFLIDNSGSMYPKELCPTSSENDVDFKRLDFASSLISKFDPDYLVSISKFTGTYTKMVDFTSNRSELDSALFDIRNNEEIFNGTHNQTALKSCINEFTNMGEGKYRNIIVMLSDGESDEVDPSTAEELSLMAKEKSIIILTVGLGRDIDRDWLQNLAYSTGGKYYSASDADALDNVYKQIVTTLNYEIISYNDSGDDVTGFSLYNTGFDAGRNGFTFKNFRTTTTASVDFGMAVLARDWYLGKVQTSLPELRPSDPSTQKMNAAGYDLEGTLAGRAYDERKPLSEVTTDIFKHTYSKIADYLDYTAKGEALQVKDKYRFDAENKGWKIDKREIEGANVVWTSVELLDLDIENGIEKIARGYNDSDAQLCAMLYRLNALQWDDAKDEFNLTGSEEGFERLEELLSLGIPVVTTIDERHTINTVALIRDSSCHRKYILRVYDNNYPDKIKELYIEKKPVAHLEIKGEYVTVKENAFTYKAVYEGKQVGLSFSDVKTH